MSFTWMLNNRTLNQNTEQQTNYLNSNSVTAAPAPPHILPNRQHHYRTTPQTTSILHQPRKGGYYTTGTWQDGDHDDSSKSSMRKHEEAV
eukprot:2294292-Pyramimonas_sp.AAC.2